MLLNFSTCKTQFGSPYQIDKAVREGRLFKMTSGVYSDTGEESEIEVIQAQYPNAIVSFDSAYFYYDMTDYIPDRYTLTIANHARRIADERVRVFYVPEDALEVGATMLDYEGSHIRIYDKERLLIDTVRMKNRLHSDQYKEVINYYRSFREELDAEKLTSYLVAFPHRDRIMGVIDEEVY